MSAVHFWQLFCLALLAALFVSFWLVYRLEVRQQIKRGEMVNYRTGDIVDTLDRYNELNRIADDLHGSNRDRSQSAFHNWH